MNTIEAMTIGKAIVELLSLKPNKETGRYATDWGDKTTDGLGRCVERIVRESMAADKELPPPHVYVIEPVDAVVPI